MITIQQQEELLERVKALSELELESFLESLKDHIANNNLVTAVQVALDLSGDDDGDELRSEISDLEDQIKELEEERDGYKETIDQIRQLI